VLSVAGVGNVVAKMLGSSNKVNNVKLTIMALQSLKKTTQKKYEVRSTKSETSTNDQNPKF